ncbi:MAG: hypothetical protein PHV36_05155 [Elusimicrobiales bacterium]|nr:hypothetical protein [Elusimicrobiales bacterium]
MGSKFVEKHKRKSVLAALMFLFNGRLKYVSIMLVVLMLSVPFVISGETLGRIIELRPVAAFLRTVGLGSMVSVMNPKYSNDMLRAALDKAAEDSAQNSFWAKFLKSINATLPPGGGPDSLAMLRGSKDEIFGPLQLNEGKDGKRGPGQVKGAVNDEERERGETGDDVNLEGLLAGGPGGPGGAGGPGGEGSGLYGDLMGQNMSGNFGGGGAGSGSGPYIDRSKMGAGGAGSRGSGMYGNVMGQSASKVPVPGSPSKVNTKKMGRVSGFSWKNVGYKTSNAKMNVQMSSKKPMFQLAQTFAMTDAAFRSKDSAYEYQAAYVGTTYDGNDSNLDVIQTDSASPVVPDTSYTGDVMTNATGLQNEALKCSQAQGTHGAAMSSDGKQMEEIGKSMGSPPSCCSSRVGAWNSKIDRVLALCHDFNMHEAQLSAACQSASSPMTCGYGKYKISPCSWLRCFLAFLLMLLFSFILLPLAVLSAAFGGDFMGPFKFVFSAVTGQKPMSIDPQDAADLAKIQKLK